MASETPSKRPGDSGVNLQRLCKNNTISNAIGQGQVELTPIQLANMTAAIANRGYYIKPHVIRPITRELPKIESGIDSIYFTPVIDGMQLVVEAGTARRALTKDITICGKTGTVENNKGKDHSVFMAFAPRENPKIAIACTVENAGNYGGTWAAPMVSLMIEKHLKGEVSEYSKKWKEPRILEANFLPEPEEKQDEDEE